MSRLTVVCLLASATLAGQADAGIFSRKKEKPDPKVHVPALIIALTTDPDRQKRENAAEELRVYDANAFPDMIPALMQALQKDKDSDVRMESAATLGRLRPINNTIGFALERAVDSDPSMQVRLTARRALFQYSLQGYRSGSGKAEEPREPAEQPTAEPPLAAPATGGVPATAASRQVAPRVGTPTGYRRPAPQPAYRPQAQPQPARAAAPLGQTGEPPLAGPEPTLAPPAAPPVPAPEEEGPRLFAPPRG